jgi:hypothetical protein
LIPFRNFIISFLSCFLFKQKLIFVFKSVKMLSKLRVGVECE